MAQSEGTSLFTWLLVGVGGYLLYEYFFAAPATTVAATTPGMPVSTPGLPATVNPTGINNTTTAPPAVTQPTVAPATPASLTAPLSVAIINQLVSGMVALGGVPNGNYSGYQWNYFAQKVFGGSYVDPGVIGSSTYNLDGYMQLYLNKLNVSGNALSGLGCASCGMGMTQSDQIYSAMMKRTPGQSVGEINQKQAHKSEWQIREN